MNWTKLNGHKWWDCNSSLTALQPQLTVGLIWMSSKSKSTLEIILTLKNFARSVYSYSFARKPTQMLKSGSSHHNTYGSQNNKGSLSLTGGGTRCLTIDVCPDILIAAAALAGAAAFYALYQAISAKGRRRRRRRFDGEADERPAESLTENFPYYWDLMFAGRIRTRAPLSPVLFQLVSPVLTSQDIFPLAVGSSAVVWKKLFEPVTSARGFQKRPSCRLES